MKKPYTLLIVDDDLDDRQLFFEAVKEINLSFKCLRAANGEEALLLLRAKHAFPDFIFLDLNMPRMNGWQFLAEVKKDFSLAHIPVIIYSTSKKPEDDAEIKQLGVLAFITKPKTFEEICNVISVAITTKQLMELSPSIALSNEK